MYVETNIVDAVTEAINNITTRQVTSNEYHHTFEVTLRDEGGMPYIVLSRERVIKAKLLAVNLKISMICVWVQTNMDLFDEV